MTTIDTFYTTADGDLITPQTLEYGKGYSLVEVQAPYGYVLNSEPVYFDVVQENSEEESGITVIEVVRSNMAQKGTITVEKSGEVFSSVAGDKGLYQPIFSVSGLEGAVYEITAARILSLWTERSEPKRARLWIPLRQERTVQQNPKNCISENMRLRKSQLRMEWC
mgnify:FL=1